ncbi:MAG: GEGP motif-containing diheme protein [Thermodesulfobacteriota bacterium]|nr:GEGP motif-containing diheme protein [Thermodesulfobacteriota bacterium]
MKCTIVFTGTVLLIVLLVSPLFAAYHHEGERDAAKFLDVYSEKAGTKLDHCALCHSGGQYNKGTDEDPKWVSLGSCQWCHYSYGYDGAGDIAETMNPYGIDYKDKGRNAAAIEAINSEDSDEDGYANGAEIAADRFPGDADDDPSKVAAPYRVYTKAQLAAMPGHSQFMLMNASRQTDDYVEYKGVPMEDLLQDAGMLETATSITVFAPDGWSNYHPLEEDPEEAEFYHVNGVYPEAVYYYHEEADIALNPEDGWCDYSAPSAKGRDDGDPIQVSGGLKMIVAYKRDGVYLQPGILNEDNKLDGEGPYRVVPPQKNPGPPDQGSRAVNQDVIWPYESSWDHNKGAASRSATIVRVEPLPEGTTDINKLEAGWGYVDQAKIIVYGAIDGSDSNGNGVLDSEEGTDGNSDFDGDGTPDYQDTDTALVRHANGIDKVCLHTSGGAFTNIEALGDEDLAVPQEGKPASSFPYGTIKLKITGLNPGESVTLTMVFPDDVPARAEVYKIDAVDGWREIPHTKNGPDSVTVTLTDGDPLTDGDGLEDGTITDPTALAVPEVKKKSGGGGSSCFIDTVLNSL